MTAPPDPAPEPADLDAWIARGIALYNTGRFWEAHEALEVMWRRTAGRERDLWQGLILAAAAMLHRARGNRHGLLTQGGNAVRKLGRGAPDAFPVETARFVHALRRCVEGDGGVPPMELRAAPGGAAGDATKDT